MRTIRQLLVCMGACGREVKKLENKYGKNSRAFKAAFMDAGRRNAYWLGMHLFNVYPLVRKADGSVIDLSFDDFYGAYRYMPKSTQYPRLPLRDFQRDMVDCRGVAKKLQYKHNREKMWPDIRKRLIEIGVKL